jgi:V/A-type H+-transporting ATPase subunit E
MTQETTVENLERALFERARRLGDEYLARARQTRERMIEEENERLRLRVERETLAAEAEAERLYRRRVQAVELQLQGELDRHRWEMMEAVKTKMRERFLEFVETGEYLSVLGRLLAEAAETLGDEELVAQLNAADRERLADRWDSFAVNAVPARKIALDPEPGDFFGGILVRAADDTVRVDSTFEGRMDRFEDPLNQAIAEILFPAGLTMEARADG